jgi:hypothetical protein
MAEIRRGWIGHGGLRVLCHAKERANFLMVRFGNFRERIIETHEYIV